ncbi:MAG TPA: hypothetical protein VGR87_01680 [Candidatus Limnocylindria bacterium]|jgi:hypothetical protein|nr:hypothetical protein [Candidatus Limnocylindria bacterium]
MATGVLIPLAGAALLLFLVVLFVQRGREGVDFSSETLFRAYLYIASFAGVIVLAFGLAALLNSGLAAAFGNEFVYGGAPEFRPPAGVCPPGIECPQLPDVAELRAQQAAELDRRRAEDLVRGVTFVAFAIPFWLVHWLARNRLGREDQGPLQRAYLLMGTAVFGVATVVLVPLGVYQALSGWLVSRPPTFYRQGISESLTAGIVSLVLWLVYLRIVTWDIDMGRGGRVDYLRPGPPPEPAPVGAPIAPSPSARSAGAEARPPEGSR